MDREDINGVIVSPPRTLTNQHTLIAQKYAGYLIGHPYRQEQQSTTITVEWAKEWREPPVVADDCIFCVRMTDEEAERRIAGYQFRIDVEVVRNKWVHYAKWVDSGSEDVPNPGMKDNDQANYRKFCDLFQDMPTDSPATSWRSALHREGWKTKPLPMVGLPLRIKRKICVEWNHCYVKWMAEEGLEYDFDTREFWRPDEPTD